MVFDYTQRQSVVSNANAKTAGQQWMTQFQADHDESIADHSMLKNPVRSTHLFLLDVLGKGIKASRKSC